MASPLRKKRGSTIIWILMGLLVLGLGGFGARNFGGSVNTIGTVGAREISLRDYARALNNEIAATSAQVGQPISFAQAEQLGLARKVQATVIAAAALDNEADTLGISVDDGEVRKRLLTINAFKGIDGSFDRDAYRLALQREGLSEAEFEARLRDEAARTLLQGAVVGATAAPDTYSRFVTLWASETRDFTLAELIPSDLTEALPEPDEAALTAYYDAHPEDFTTPETRRITYAWVTPDMVAGEVKLDEEALRKVYQDRIDEFVTPERRLVERLVYPDEASAEDAKARFDSGAVTFEDLAAERGLTLADADLGEVSQDDLGAAGAAVFALEAPGVVGPLQSDLGPALYAMNGILDAQEITFEEARADLALEAGIDRARRLIDDRRDGVEDMLASGATLEEVTRDTPMELGQIAFSSDSEGGIAAYSSFREAAEAAAEGDFPTLVQLDDGGVFALRLDAIDPPKLRPLDEVRAEVTEGWRTEETHRRLVALGEEIAEELSAEAEGAEGDAAVPSLERRGLVVTRYQGFARGGFIDGAPPAVAAGVFEGDAGTTRLVDAEGQVFLLTVEAVHPADPEDPEVTQTMASLKAQLDQAIAQDMFQLYVTAIEADAGISLDAAALNAVHAQMN